MTFDRHPDSNEIREFQAEQKRALQEDTAQKRFLGGFFGLPCLWLINAIHYRHMWSEEAPQHAKIRYCELFFTPSSLCVRRSP